MSYRKVTTRNFIIRSGMGLASSVLDGDISINANEAIPDTTYKNRLAFINEVKKLPRENPYDYHRYLSHAPLHTSKKNKKPVKESSEIAIEQNWRIVY